MDDYLYRDAGTGRIVTEEYATEHPDTTVREEITRAAAIDIVFDGPPSEPGRFVEVHLAGTQTGVGVGTWVELGGGYWGLRLQTTSPLNQQSEADDGA